MNSQNCKRQLIILSVHESINSDYITEVLENSYNFKSEQFEILLQQNSRLQGQLDSILLAPSFLKAIITDGGIYIGHKKCRLKPFTAIQRCIKCKLYGHVERFCQNDVFCEIWR